MSDVLSFDEPPLKLTPSTVVDANQTVRAADLPDVTPEHDARLTNATPIVEKAWRIALDDIESNLVEEHKIRYFGAGEKFGTLIYTRDIAYAGILGVNRIYPGVMMSSIKHTRDKRLEVGLSVSETYEKPDVPLAWEETPISHKDFKMVHGTNSFMRRTDDVVWLWAVADLFMQVEPTEDDWRWLFAMGETFFQRFYSPFFDRKLGLFRGQASFIDIHFPDEKTTGYPAEWSPADCVMIFPTSTNALYVKGMDAMALAAEKLHRLGDVEVWRDRAAALRKAMRRHLRFDDGGFTYFRHTDGTLEPRREALGAALAVLAGVVEGEEAVAAVADYPVTDQGVPLFHPFYDRDDFYHNNSSWPFVDTFFLWAKGLATGEHQVARNLTLLLRTLQVDGTFHEVVDWRTNEIKGSGRQLWTAAAYVNAVLRGGVS